MTAKDLIDTHCHPQYLVKENYSFQDFIKDNQIPKQYLMVSITPEEAQLLQGFALQDLKRAFYSIGTHPSHAHEHNFEDIIRQVRQALENPQLCALGETGLDYYHTTKHKKVQQDSFCAHLELSQETQLPVIVHTRSAPDDTLAILKEFPQTKGVIHCFTESLEFAKKALDCGYYLSFSGIITFKKADEIREVVRYCPADRILAETDAPFLAPIPHRGRDNHPRWVELVYQKISELKKLPVEEISSQITRNCYRLFDKMSTV